MSVARVKCVSILKLSACVLIVLLSSLVSQGKVFLRWGSGGEMIEPARVGWREAFRGEVEVDGVAIETQVLASRSGCRASLERIGSVFEREKARFYSFADTEMGWGMALWPDRRANVFVLAPHVWQSALVFIFHSRAREGDPAESASFRDLPDYPGSVASRTAARPESGLKVRFLSTNAAAGEVLNFYENSLVANGWNPMISDRLGRSASRMPLLYYKGSRFCCISVKTSGLGEKNVITVLMKENKN